MIKYILVDSNGVITQQGAVATQAEFEIFKMLDITAFEVKETVDADNLYYDYRVKKLRKYPTKPEGRYKWEGYEWVKDDNKALLLEQIRSQRDQLLAETDWALLPDVVLANQDEIIAYRTALRDITEQEDLYNIKWPNKPVGIK